MKCLAQGHNMCPEWGSNQQKQDRESNALQTKLWVLPRKFRNCWYSYFITRTCTVIRTFFRWKLNLFSYFAKRQIVGSCKNLEPPYWGDLTHCILGNFSCFFVVCWFFQNYLFEKNLSEIPSECQTVWTLIRPDDPSGLIWVQTVCQD